MEYDTNLEKLTKDWRKYYLIKGTRKMTPPIFFHEKAVKYCKNDNENFLNGNHIEYIYATLVSWGMHRAGDKGSKMPPFEIFMESILRNKACIDNLRKYSIDKINEELFKEILPCLTCLCFNIQATTCNSKIVSSSKTLAHILPDLICPIDHRYTLTFFKDDMKGMNEMEKFKYIMTQMWMFFQNKEIIQNISLDGTFAHSLPKIFDNLIIEYVRQNNLIQQNNKK